MLHELDGTRTAQLCPFLVGVEKVDVGDIPNIRLDWDRIAAERRALPWVSLEKSYVFDTPEGKKTLAELFDGRGQLFVKHFMLGPGQVTQCVGCSFEDVATKTATDKGATVHYGPAEVPGDVHIIVASDP